MKKLIKIALSAALPVMVAAGCSDYLKGGELTNNPNNPQQGSATNGQLFMSIQTNMFIFQEGDMGRAVAQWMQSMVGVQRQQIGIYNYSGVSNATYDAEFQRPYGGGGLTDIRTLEANATTQGDLRFLGIAQVMEAWFMGTTADVWGDVPYSQADSFFIYPTPILDTQQSVYNAVEALLSQAITNLAGAGAGPGGNDLVYGGDPASWIALAHTLKARFYLHQAGVPSLQAAMYANAVTEAGLGISSNAGDYVAYHVAGLQLSENSWYQFMDANGGTGRAGDLVAGVIVPTSPTTADTIVSTLWTSMKASGDSRFAEYFDLANTGGGSMSFYRLDGGYPQPLVTYNENLLIKAEAELATAPATALADLNAEQLAWADSINWHTKRVVPATTATLANIMNEKFITLFQNIEVWNDWKRTCIPSLTPVASIGTFNGGIPSRMLYGASEQQTNPNIPAVGTGSNGAYNWNEPTPCP